MTEVGSAEMINTFYFDNLVILISCSRLEKLAQYEGNMNKDVKKLV